VPHVPPVVSRLAPALPAALLTGWVTSTFAFWPTYWPLLLAGLAALLTVIGPRVGLAFALATALVLGFSLWALRGLRSAEHAG